MSAGFDVAQGQSGSAFWNRDKYGKFISKYPAAASPHVHLLPTCHGYACWAAHACVLGCSPCWLDLLSTLTRAPFLTGAPLPRPLPPPQPA